MLNPFDRPTLVAGGPPDAASLPALAAAHRLTPAGVLEQLRASGLTGRGGAHYPAHRKLERFLAIDAADKVLVVNGGEHEPGSAKDRWLLEQHADTVLEGALCVACAGGATEIRIAVNETHPASIAAVERAIGRLRAKAGSELPALQVCPIPDLYIVGEETALLEALEGRDALPRERPPYPIERGLQGRPTLIHNVETVAHVPFILLHGADAWRNLGRDGGGPMLCTFGAEFVHAGVRLVPAGVPLAELVEQHGGGLRSGLPLKALQVGGPSSAYLRPAQLDLRLDAAALAAAGVALGCAAVRAWDIRESVVDAAAQATGWFAAASCGQCPACRMQTRTLSAIVRQLADGRATRKLLAQVPLVTRASGGKGLCGLIRMPVAPVESLLRDFDDDVASRLAASPILHPTKESAT